MTRKEKKVAIAKDVIANIHMKKLNVKANNGYVESSDKDLEYDKDILCQYLPSEQVAELLKPSCQICARGAMMICKVAKFDNFDLGRYSLEEELSTTEALKDAFSEEELGQIEAAFELWGPGSPMGEHKRLSHEELENWESIEKDEDRLLAIMQNIVDHGGEFKPEVKYEVYWK